MNEKELDKFILNLINKKLEENSEFIRYTFYELKVKNNLTDEEMNNVLQISKMFLKNRKYRVYLTDEKFEYQNATRKVQSNEMLIAIKEGEK